MVADSGCLSRYHSYLSVLTATILEPQSGIDDDHDDFIEDLNDADEFDELRIDKILNEENASTDEVFAFVDALVSKTIDFDSFTFKHPATGTQYEISHEEYRKYLLA